MYDDDVLLSLYLLYRS